MTMHFVVMGVPRSGTTATVNALNLHPEIMCGDEYFPNVETACAATLPSAFEDEKTYRMPNGDRTRTLFRLKKNEALIFGDKDPRYFFRLPDLNTAAPSCKKICIYRPKLGFWNSWDARARNRDDAYWGRGQTGFFGVLELIGLLGAIADVDSSGEVLIVNYDDLFFENPDTIHAIYDYLGAGPNSDVAASFRKSLFSPAGVSRNQPNADAEQVYRHLQLAQLEQMILTQPVVTNVEVADILREYCRSCRPLTMDLIDSRFPNMPMAELAYFLNAKGLRSMLGRQNIRARAQQAIEADKRSSDHLGPDLSQLQRRFDELATS